MDAKMKVVLGIFAVIALIYIIHFSISYVNRRKKESFTDEEDEHFADEPGTDKDASYKFGMKLLKLVDDKADVYSLNKKTKAEVVKDLFVRTDELKKMGEAELITEVDKTAKMMKDKAESFEDSTGGGDIVKTPAIPAAEAPKPVAGSEAKPPATETVPAAPVGDKTLPVEDDIKSKMGIIRTHLKDIGAIVDSIAPVEAKKGLLTVPPMPTPSIKPTGPAAPAVKETFVGFENHVANFASWDF